MVGVSQHIKLVSAVNQAAVNRRDSTPRSAIWTCGLWFVLILGFMAGLANQTQAAGCQHAAGAAEHSSSQHRLDDALLGKWQYAGGTVYYVFHPVPAPCDGPACRQSPRPASQMNVIPTSSSQLTLATALGQPLPLLMPPAQGRVWPIDQPLSCSPTLSGMLRPPC